MKIRTSIVIGFLTLVPVFAGHSEDCVLVSNAYSARISKVDTALNSTSSTLSVADSVGVPVPNISTILYDSVRHCAYVADHLAGAISVIDLGSWSTSGPVMVAGMGKMPIGMALNKACTRLYVATRGADGVDDPTDPLEVIGITGSAFPPTLTRLGAVTVGKHPINVILSHDEQFALVTCRNQSCLTVVNTASITVAYTHTYPDATYEPEGIDLHPTANLAYVFTHGHNTIDLFDLDSMRMVGSAAISYPTPPQPSGGVFSPDGTTVLVSCQTIGKVLVFNTTDPYHPVQTSTQISVGPQPHRPLFLSTTRAYVPNTNNTQPIGSISILTLSGTWANTGQVAGTFNGPLSLTMAPSAVASIRPLYLTFVSHNEEPNGQPGYPDYLNDQTTYLKNREAVRLTAQTVNSKGAIWNFQSDWNFLKAVARYDTGAVVGNTNGKNIVRWLVEDMGVEADPHAHETQYNYADVAYLFTQISVAPSKNVGGFLYDPPDNNQGWEQHEQGTFGDVYPSYFWKPDNMWGAATYMHQGNDDASTGVWKPKDRYNFYVHDSTKHLAYIGGGCVGGLSAQGEPFPSVKAMLDAIAARTTSPQDFYTATMFIPQSQLNLTMINTIARTIDSIAPYVTQGRVVWSSLTNTGNLWRTSFAAQAFRVACADIRPASCCVASTGNVDCDPGDGVDISDLSALVDHLYVSLAPLCCDTEANIDGDLSGGIDISDLSALVDHLYVSFVPPAPCR